MGSLIEKRNWRSRYVENLPSSAVKRIEIARLYREKIKFGRLFDWPATFLSDLIWSSLCCPIHQRSVPAALLARSDARVREIFSLRKSFHSRTICSKRYRWLLTKFFWNFDHTEWLQIHLVGIQYYWINKLSENVWKCRLAGGSFDSKHSEFENKICRLLINVLLMQPLRHQNLPTD